MCVTHSVSWSIFCFPDEYCALFSIELFKCRIYIFTALSRVPLHRKCLLGIIWEFPASSSMLLCPHRNYIRREQVQVHFCDFRSDFIFDVDVKGEIIHGLSSEGAIAIIFQWKKISCFFCDKKICIFCVIKKLRIFFCVIKFFVFLCVIKKYRVNNWKC